MPLGYVGQIVQVDGTQEDDDWDGWVTAGSDTDLIPCSFKP